MPDIIFEVTSTNLENNGQGGKSYLKSGILKWPAKNLEAQVVSGPFGKGALPKGIYTVKGDGFDDRPPGDDHFDTNYCDKDQKNCWFHWFDTSMLDPIRSDIGFHPDYDTSGTNGCIGIKEQDTSAWKASFEALGPNDTVMFEITA